MFFNRSRQPKAYSPGQIIWRRFVTNRIGLTALIFIVISACAAIAGYLIAPDKTPFANRQILELATQKPGFGVDLLRVKTNNKVNEQHALQTMLFGKRSAYTEYPFSRIRFVQDSVLIDLFDPEPGPQPLQLSFHLANVLFALDEIIFSHAHEMQVKTLDGNILHMPVAEAREKVVQDQVHKQRFWLGTDQFGRDLLSRLLIGTRVSLSVGFISVFISLLIGIALGSLGGYFRGAVDDLIMWLINVTWSIPTLLMVIAITFALGKGFWQVFVAVGLTMWVEVARVVRGQIISIREKEFVEAGRALGYSDFRIIAKHILPNIISPVIVISAANFASAILVEAGLSFLGLGVQPPVPSWGSMIKENYAFIILDSPYLAILPGIAIMLMVLAFMLTGNALRDAQDVKLSGHKN